MAFWRQKHYSASGSLSNLAWIRFTHNKLGMASLMVIGFFFGIAILGYLITPDSTPFANTQILEVSTQKPGFKVQVLKVRKNQPAHQKNFISRMLFGQPSDFIDIPISDYSFSKENIEITLFDPEGTGLEARYRLIDVIYPVETDELTGKLMLMSSSYRESPVVSNEELKKMVLNEHIQTRRFWLGTDQFGRDLLSRLIIGTRVSLSVGLISVAISLIVGILLGSVAGFFRGRTDDIIVWFINVVWSIPTLLLVIAITFALGRGFWQIFIAVGLTMWVEVARVVRGQIMSLREKEFIEAGFALGFSNFRIITRHLLPNILSPVIVISAANFAAAILIEAGLSFLGIGVQPPMPSWGSMIKEYYSFIILDSAYLALAPGIAIVILVLAFMTLGNTLRDALDVKLETA
ncbi:MAG: ABC transporter permease [bacterium]